MSTAATTTQPGPATRRAAVTATRRTPAPIPFSRLVRVELQKMFDTRAGFWLCTSIVIVAVLAQVAITAFGPESAITFESYATAMGAPLSIILPLIAILSVTSEWSQRGGLVTFTLVPHRGRVITAKGVAALVVGLLASVVSIAIGALGYLAGSTIAGVDRSWDLSVTSTLLTGLALTIALGMGFVLGLLFRSSPGAIVGYFVYTALLPALFGTLAGFQQWFADAQPWVDLNYASMSLYDSVPDAEGWLQLASAAGIWLVLPLVVGAWLLRRSEIK
ncbi:ABC transporter permease [Nocardioides massiliensis]|uniref:ABC-type transport system involved in multi-copper enzyme maturation permease subunit n=1 Tax=Nocardioides massiliensis TaxID=1325935 RepID=A0ABT9NMN0_9ACTN|nr:ABC transporter permease [Nocardioides massiliensis]MDP9821090.1 ABC-type transport system involved in multi-copper enzyme maturation permease subunit [Nocardioides massiliensis]